jgi:hypothetical protein
MFKEFKICSWGGKESLFKKRDEISHNTAFLIWTGRS